MVSRKYQAVVPHPCPNCHFRADRLGFLSRPRAQQIADSLRRGESFTCHKTNDFDNEAGETVLTEFTD